MYWPSIVLFESGITWEKAKFRFFWFLLEVSFRYHFQGFMFKEHLWPRINNKNIAFVGKGRKEIFLKKPRSVLQKCVLQFSNNKIKLRKVLQKIKPQSRTSHIEQFPMLSSKYYKNNKYFSLGCVNCVSN